MKYKQIALSLFLGLLSTLPCFSQVRIVIMGSSSAQGIGASVDDSSYATRTRAYYNRNSTDGLDTIVDNIGRAGYTTYQEMPDGFPTPPNRPGIEGNANVTRALRDHPAAIVINLPTNDISNGYTKQEYMNNLRLMYNTITLAGTLCYITTPQPRGGLVPALLDSLLTLVDSVKNNFGIFALDFWIDLYMDATPPFKPEVRSYDVIHVNDVGHRYLFNRLVSRLFLSGGPLPIKLQKFSAILNGRSIQLKWQTDLEEEGTVFELQRSSADNKFTPVYSAKATGESGIHNYEWTDFQPLQGDNLYRLRILEPGQAPFYSKIQSVKTNPGALSIDKISTESGRIAVEVNALSRISLTLSVFNHVGALLYSHVYKNPEADKPLYIPASLLTPGILLLRIEAANGQTATRRFIAN